MPDWLTHRWIDDAAEATLAVIAAADEQSADVVARLGPAELLGDLDFAAALAAQTDLYGSGAADERAVVQVDALERAGERWFLTLEPNGYRADQNLDTLAAGLAAVSLYWNVNGVMRLRRRDGDGEMLAFDPATQVDAVPEEGLGLPFGCQAPRAASLALIERWTGVTISRDWFYGPKPTWLVTSPLP